MGKEIKLKLCYTIKVHKPFYASGFLYHPPSKKILLQQLQIENNVKLVLLRGKSNNDHNPQTVFQQTLTEMLGESFDITTIRPIYDYVHDKLGEHYIFYVEVTEVEPKTYKSKHELGWFSLAKLSKFAMSEQTRHDIVVGERVIRSLYEVDHPPVVVRRG